jgi:nascent polypeptide-associated complex subunit alpha
MFGGGDSRRMKKMMDQMGIEMDELDGVREVVIETDDAVYRFDAPDVTSMEAQGQTTFQVVGEPTVEEGGAADTAGGETESGGVADEDVELVAERAGVSEDEAREALEASDGDLADAINSLG